MANEHGEWIMRGVTAEDPLCLHTPEELIALIDEIGFLPLFRNEVPLFSVEERTPPADWWSDSDRDPWRWRQILAESGRVAYGKFFDKKAGFLSLKWLPVFANWRRDGYDFDARWDDGKATRRQKKIMDLFSENDILFSFDVRQKAGFGKEGERGFEGTLSDLQGQTYLVVGDFQRRLNKKGEPYGWAIARYTTPEARWGYEAVTAAYEEEPEASRARIFARAAERFPTADPAAFLKILR